MCVCGIRGLNARLLGSFFSDVVARATRGFATRRGRFRRVARELLTRGDRSAPCLATTTTITATTITPNHPRRVLVRYTTPVYSTPRLFVLFRCADREASLLPPYTFHPPRSASILRRTMRKFAYLVDLNEREKEREREGEKVAKSEPK